MRYLQPREVIARRFKDGSVYVHGYNVMLTEKSNSIWVKHAGKQKFRPDLDWHPVWEYVQERYKTQDIPAERYPEKGIIYLFTLDKSVPLTEVSELDYLTVMAAALSKDKTAEPFAKVVYGNLSDTMLFARVVFDNLSDSILSSMGLPAEHKDLTVHVRLKKDSRGLLFDLQGEEYPIHMLSKKLPPQLAAVAVFAAAQMPDEYVENACPADMAFYYTPEADKKKDTAEGNASPEPEAAPLFPTRLRIFLGKNGGMNPSPILIPEINMCLVYDTPSNSYMVSDLEHDMEYTPRFSLIPVAEYVLSSLVKAKRLPSKDALGITLDWIEMSPDIIAGETWSDAVIISGKLSGITHDCPLPLPFSLDRSDPVMQLMYLPEGTAIPGLTAMIKGHPDYAEVCVIVPENDTHRGSAGNATVSVLRYGPYGTPAKDHESGIPALEFIGEYSSGKHLGSGTAAQDSVLAWLVASAVSQIRGAELYCSVLSIRVRTSVTAVKADPELDYIAANVKAARISRGQSQSDLAKQLGISQSAISRIECGDMDIPLSMLRSLRYELKLPFDRLLSQNTVPYGAKVWVRVTDKVYSPYLVTGADPDDTPHRSVYLKPLHKEEWLDMTAEEVKATEYASDKGVVCVCLSDLQSRNDGTYMVVTREKVYPSNLPL